MKKFILFCLLGVMVTALTSCNLILDQKEIDERNAAETAAWYARVNTVLKSNKGFEDCEYAAVNVEGLSLSVIRCPHSTTTTQRASKNPVTTVVDSE